jgi:signal transduction histidine kinase
VTPPDRAAPVLAAAVLAAAGARTHLDATLHDIVQAAVQHVDAEYGAMGVLTRDGRRLDRFVVVGATPGDGRPADPPHAGLGLLGLLVDQPGALYPGGLDGDPAARAGGGAGCSFLGVPVRVGAAVFGNLYLTQKRSGGPFTDADVELARALAAVAGLAIDNARLVERAEQRRAWAQEGMEVATALLSGADPDEVLRSAAERLAVLASADVAGVLAATTDQDVLTIVSAVGPDAPVLDAEGVRLPVRNTRLLDAHRSGLPRLIDEIGTPSPGGPRDEVLDEFTERYGPALIIPLGGSPARGTAVALRAHGREPFDPELLDLAATYAAQATIAMELVRSHERERRLQLEADRDRIARDLHDHVVQRIFATALSLDRIGRSLEGEAPEAAARIAERVDELDGTIDRIRTAIFELHEAEDASPAAVRRRIAEVVRSVTEEHDLRSDLRIRTGADDLAPDLVPELIAVVRELVTNVVRHAGATRLTVTVDLTEDAQVTVTDDGRGLPPIAGRSGLANLADRAERRRGRLAISSGPTGTEVRWTVPRPVGQ